MEPGPAMQPLALVPKLRRSVRAYIGSRVANDSLAEDLTQDVLRRALAQLHTLRNPLRIEPWIMRLARHRIVDHFRSPQSREVALSAEPADEADGAATALLEREEAVLRGQLHAYLRKVIATLPPMHREALELTEWSGLSQVEFARRRGLSVSAAKSRVQRARRALRAEMEHCCRFEADCYGRIVDVQPRRRTKS